MVKLLIVVDMQNDFIDGALGTKEAVAIVPKVAAKIQGFEGDVLYTKDTHTQDYAQTQEGRLLPIPHCLKPTAGWELSPPLAALQQAKNSLVLEKESFGAKELPNLLQQRYPAGCESIELIGLCTDICVISNALLLKAFLPETPILVDSACCAGVTPKSHQTALDAMAQCQIMIK